MYYTTSKTIFTYAEPDPSNLTKPNQMIFTLALEIPSSVLSNTMLAYIEAQATSMFNSSVYRDTTSNKITQSMILETSTSIITGSIYNFIADLQPLVVSYSHS